VRIVFRQEGEQIVGCNFLGIRQRQTTWQGWIREGHTLDYALENLRAACFDPKLFRPFEATAVAACNQQRKRNARVKGHRNIWSGALA
jgi:hypothetical protein